MVSHLVCTRLWKHIMTSRYINLWAEISCFSLSRAWDRDKKIYIPTGVEPKTFAPHTDGHCWSYQYAGRVREPYTLWNLREGSLHWYFAFWGILRFKYVSSILCFQPAKISTVKALFLFFNLRHDPYTRLIVIFSFFRFFQSVKNPCNLGLKPIVGFSQRNTTWVWEIRSNARVNRVASEGLHELL